MKRTIILLLCLALALSLFAGCRAYMPFLRLPGEDPTTEPAAETEPATTEAPRPLTAEEIREAALERLRSANSLAAELRLDMGITFEYEGETQSEAMQLTLDGELMIQPMAFHGSGRLSINNDEELLPIELYLFAEDGSLAIYSRGDETATFGRLAMPLPEEEVQASEGSPLWILWDLETREENYGLSHTVTAEEARRYWAAAQEKAKDDLAQLEEMGVDPDCFRELLTGMKLELTVDRETLELREASADLSEGFGSFLRQLVTGLVRTMLGEDGEDASFDEFRDASLRFGLKLHNYDGVAPFTAPEDYEDLGDLSDLMTGLGGNSEFETGPILEELDDSYSLEDYAFRLSEITPRDLVGQGWTVTDAIFMRSMGKDNPYTALVPAENRKDPNAAPELSEAGMLDPNGMVQIYLAPTDQEDSPFNPLRLGVVNTGEEAAHYLDCPIRFFSINETGFYEQSEEGLVDFTGPAGIARGMDKAQLTALLGEPVSEDSDNGLGMILYLSQQMEELVLLLGADGSLQAMFYQDLVLYDPADYVFHN